MYDGTLSHAAFQLTALTTRYAALAHALKVPGVELVIAERSLGSDRRVFAHTHLGELEVRAYAATPPPSRAPDDDTTHDAKSITLRRVCRPRARRTSPRRWRVVMSSRSHIIKNEV